MQEIQNQAPKDFKDWQGEAARYDAQQEVGKLDGGNRKHRRAAASKARKIVRAPART